jgi:two-component system, sensor histidine kinase and response regulator
LELINYQNLSQQEFTLYSKDLRRKIDAVYNNLNNLLNWSVTQLQGIQTKASSFDIGKLADEVCDLYTEVSEQKGVSLVHEMEDNVQVMADRDQIHLVLRNLISNSIKFTPTGGLIKIYYSRLGSNELNVNVEDSGMGIGEKDLERLFTNDSLWTINGTNNEKGLGLGLRLCKEFIERNKGKLTVRSQVGIGTTFNFTLPVSTEAESKSEEVDHLERASA